MRDSKWLRIGLILWVIILIVVSMISLEPRVYDTLRIFLVGLGAVLLAYMAGLHKAVGLGLLLYLLAITFIAYSISSPKTGLSYTMSIILLTPILIVAVYAWIKRPKL